MGAIHSELVSGVGSPALFARAQDFLGPAIGGLVCGVLIGTLIGAVILRAACALFNKMAGGGESSGGVPEPEFGKAVGITFVTFLVQFGVGVVVGLAMAGEGAATGTGQSQGSQLITNLITLPIGFLVMSGMLTAMLPTTFPRAMLVALLEYLIMIAIFAFIGVVFFFALGGASMLGK